MPAPLFSSEPDLTRLAGRMTELRNAKGLTYEQLAERSGLSRRGVIALERKERIGEMRTWFLIATALGVSFAEFVSVLDKD